MFLLKNKSYLRMGTNWRQISNASKRASVDVCSDDYQFMDDGAVSTDKFAASMPALPVPALGQTLRRYLESQRPLLTAEQMRVTTTLAREFERGVGARLDAELRRWQAERGREEASFASLALQSEYLKSRQSLVCGSNSGCRLPTTESSPHSAAQSAASLLVSSLRFFKSLRANRLRPPVGDLRDSGRIEPLSSALASHFPESLATPLARVCLGVCPTDISTFKHLFQSARIPCHGKDRLAWHPEAKNVVVMRKGHVYSFEALDADWNLFHPDFYRLVMEGIVHDSVLPAPPGIAALTTEDRETWAELRRHVSSIGRNGQVLQKIEQALLMICLDDDWQDGETEQNDLDTLEYITQGFNPNNRWYDKTYTLLIGQSGQAAFHYEHSWGDGYAMQYFADRIIKDDIPRVGFSKNVEGTFERLEFEVDEHLCSSVQRAREKFQHLKKAHSCRQCEIKGFERQLCKSSGISPDFIMQIAFQLAYYKLKGKFAPTFESCSTAAHRFGRIEVIRPFTMESKKFIELFVKMKRITPVLEAEPELFTLLQSASHQHRRLIRQASSGQAWDMHLYHLQHLCLDLDLELPHLFRDEAFVSMQQDMISSSESWREYCKYGVAFPTIPEGYAFFYNFSGDVAMVNIATQKSNCDDMKLCLEETFQDLHSILPKKKS